MSIQIKELTTIIAGAFVSQFAVTDEQGRLLGSKAHKTREEAEVEMASLRYFAKGLQFARATNPNMKEKALVGKANIVAAFLLWQEQGEPTAITADEIKTETNDINVIEEVNTTEEAKVTEAPEAYTPISLVKTHDELVVEAEKVITAQEAEVEAELTEEEEF